MTEQAIIYRTDEPTLAAVTDAAGADALVMSFDEWQEHIPAYEFEPEPAFWQEG